MVRHQAPATAAAEGYTMKKYDMDILLMDLVIVLGNAGLLYLYLGWVLGW